MAKSKTTTTKKRKAKTPEVAEPISSLTDVPVQNTEVPAHTPWIDPEREIKPEAGDARVVVVEDKNYSKRK